MLDAALFDDSSSHLVYCTSFSAGHAADNVSIGDTHKTTTHQQPPCCAQVLEDDMSGAALLSYLASPAITTNVMATISLLSTHADDEKYLDDSQLDWILVSPPTYTHNKPVKCCLKHLWGLIGCN